MSPPDCIAPLAVGARVRVEAEAVHGVLPRVVGGVVVEVLERFVVVVTDDGVTRSVRRERVTA